MDLVEFSADNAVALIRLNRPPVNALSSELVADLGTAIDAAGHPSIRAVVVTGRPHFAVGADIKEFGAVFEGQDFDLAGNLGLAVSRLEHLDKPTIAAVAGFALGGGLELALGADFRYLADDAQVGQPEIKLGLIPGAGGTQRLARIAGWQHAKELVVTGRSIDATEAQRLGLADRVLPAAELVDAALADAARWATGPTRAIAAAKRAFNAGSSIEHGLDVELAEFKALFTSEDAREGVAAFIDKREPDFTGT